MNRRIFLKGIVVGCAVGGLHPDVKAQKYSPWITPEEMDALLEEASKNCGHDEFYVELERVITGMTPDELRIFDSMSYGQQLDYLGHLFARNGMLFPYSSEDLC